LLISKTQDVGIVTTSKFDSPVTAAIFDHKSRQISLEFGETMDSLMLNIPVAEDLINYIINRSNLFIIGTDRELIHEARQIPLMHINDVNKVPSKGGW
jgi:hypothetical protein